VSIHDELVEKLKKIQESLHNSEIISRERIEQLGTEALNAFDSALQSFHLRVDIKKELLKQKEQLTQWKVGFFHSLRPCYRLVRHLISMPFIYSMIVPSVILHIFIEMYQQVCFRLYNIPRVKARDYFIFDRSHLPYLNGVEMMHCVYCSYVNCLFQFAVEIGGRTERYWCPIKYANKRIHTHSQYDQFVEFFDGQTFHEKWEKLRDFSDIRAQEKNENEKGV